MNKKRNSVNVNLGTSSILLIFFVLSLVSFSVLSLSSALSDKRLTDKTFEKSDNYYEACNQIQKLLKDYDDTCFEAYSSSSDEASYLSKLDESTAFTLEANETQDLVVTVVPTFPKEKDDHLYTITSWKLVEAREPAIDYSIPVFK